MIKKKNYIKLGDMILKKHLNLNKKKFENLYSKLD